MGFHHALTGDSLHVPGYCQPDDPGAVGAGRYWIDTSPGGGAWALKARTPGNDGWQTVARGNALTALAQDPAPALGGNLALNGHALVDVTAIHLHAPVTDLPAGANVTVNGAAIREMLVIAAKALEPAAVGGAALGSPLAMTTNGQTFRLLEFADGANPLAAECDITLPANWDGGPVTAQFLWTADTTAPGDVRWGLDGLVYGDGGALDAAYGAAGTVTDAHDGTPLRLRVSAETPAITLANAAAGRTAHLRVTRDPSVAGNLPATALLHSVVLRFAVNRFARA